ncbi:MAG: hypothetical protein K2K67_07395, partial [Treponemataceae bacterium]|nr:hypothetical protein [Treponemataceae bacterium]
MRRFFVMVAAFLVGATLFAEIGRWQTDDYALSIQYNKTVQPGDAVFARLIIKPRVKKTRKLTGTSTADMQFFAAPSGDSPAKPLGKTAMYLVNRRT